MTRTTETIQAVPTGAAFLLPRKVHEMTRPKTIIEFIEPVDFPDVAATHKSKEVRINGVPVLVRADDIELTFGNGEITQVTLTLIPAEVHFRAAEPFKETP